MASGAVMEQVDSIGTVAGLVWTYLDVNGPVALTRLVKEVDAPRDLIMQGIGWLAREGKVTFLQEGSRSKVISLT